PPQTHAWFIGTRGDLAVAVLVEGGGVGGRGAAPIARRGLGGPPGGPAGGGGRAPGGAGGRPGRPARRADARPREARLAAAPSRGRGQPLVGRARRRGQGQAGAGARVAARAVAGQLLQRRGEEPGAAPGELEDRLVAAGRADPGVLGARGGVAEERVAAGQD